jgi:protein-tyrosine-phosphatase
VHPGAVRAAAIAGLDLTGARPRRLAEIGGAEAMFVVTVCDRVHEELAPGPGWWHWSIPDPVDDPRPDAFDRALAALKGRIDTLARGADHE